MAGDDTTRSLIERLVTERNTILGELLAPLTRRGYRYDWVSFRKWCEARGLAPLPATPETLELYITCAMARHKLTTIVRRIASVTHMHKAQGIPSPVTERVHTLIHCARRLKPQTVRQVKPLSLADMRQISIVLARQSSTRALRDRAILVVGFCSALRGSSLAALLLSDVEFTEQGIILHIHREKNDQVGKGRLIGLPFGKDANTCPVRVLQAWLERRRWDAGPLFTRMPPAQKHIPLQGEGICGIVKRAVRLIGLDPRQYGSHSLRSGMITECGEAGVGELLIASQSGHRDMATLRRYFRRSDVFKANACDALGL